MWIIYKYMYWSLSGFLLDIFYIVLVGYNMQVFGAYGILRHNVDVAFSSDIIARVSTKKFIIYIASKLIAVASQIFLLIILIC